MVLVIGPRQGFKGALTWGGITKMKILKGVGFKGVGFLLILKLKVPIVYIEIKQSGL